MWNGANEIWNRNERGSQRRGKLGAIARLPLSCRVFLSTETPNDDPPKCIFGNPETPFERPYLANTASKISPPTVVMHAFCVDRWPTAAYSPAASRCRGGLRLSISLQFLL